VRTVKNPLSLRAAVWLGLGLVTLAAAPREPNTTLRLPPVPPTYGFALTPAFPGLSFSAPMALTAPPGETNQLFVVERTGRIQVITNLTAPNQSLFLDISARVNTSGEGGLLGLAFHPGYQTNGWFFVYYTLTASTSAGTGFHDRLARFERSASNPFQASPASEVPLITQLDEASNHNGGDIHFGPDGYLYVALGDEGGAGDAYRNSRRIDRDFFAAILRLDVDQRPGSLAPNSHPAVGTGYAIPPDNPFVGATSFNGAAVDPADVRTEFWAVGLRNPWRMSFDPVTGWLYAGDVGQGAWEEINLIQRGGDYGWNYREGLHPYTGTPPAGVAFIDPIWEYPHTGSPTNRGNSVTGGVVYRGTRLSQIYGHYVFADYGSANLWALLYDGTRVVQHQRLTTASSIVELGTDPANGDVLLASINGPISRLTYNSIPVGDPLPPTLAETGAFTDLLSLTPQPGIIPYQINAPFWSDHALKTRWFSVPDTNDFLGFNPEGSWDAPEGTVWIKHFELELTNGLPESRRRLETRFLVRHGGGSYGVTYRWDNTQTEATLVPEEGLDESLVIRDGSIARTQVWHYPARSECLICHAPVAGHALSFNTFQLNRDTPLDDGVTNQILALAALGYFTNAPEDAVGLPAFADAATTAASVEHRARSYLSVNCVQCHQPGAAARGSWDARFTTPLDQAGILNGLLEDYRGNPANRVVVPGSTANSMILTRISSLEPGHMPPLATSVVNTQAVALLSEWIEPSARFTGISPIAGGQLELRLTGVPSRSYRLQSSANLLTWEQADTLVADATGQAVQILPITDAGAQFYRVVWP
jgi:glucose/arabinose dehydrogenase